MSINQTNVSNVEIANQTITGYDLDDFSESNATFVFSCLVIGSLGFVFNLICYLVLLAGNFKETIYKYLRVEALLIAVNLFNSSLRIVYYYRRNLPSLEWLILAHKIYCLTYAASFLEMTAFLSHILSALDFYLLVSNYKQRSKVFQCIEHYRTICSFILISSALAYLFQCFEYEIQAAPISDQDSSLLIVTTDFHQSRVKIVIEIVVALVRDGLNLIILIVLNALIYFKVSRSISRKEQILATSNTRENATISQSPTVEEAGNHHRVMRQVQRARQKTTLMVILSSFNFLCGRIPILLVFILRNFYKTAFVRTLDKIAVIAVNLSYALNFFFLFSSNKRFRKCFGRNMRQIKSFLVLRK
nr:G protein-coupled receptor [Proales similis]